MEITFTPIGHVENEFDHLTSTDELRRSESRIVVNEDLAEGLEGIKKFEKLLIVFHFHLAPKGYELRLYPQGDTSRPKRGVFALCSPRRPNPIGVTIVDLVRMEGNVLVVRGLDALNGSPVLDIKPFITETRFF
ncbi:MAG: tRNA (N6-threonylcarbamoyladenosine(37)-N6)-methyltransferase TrmO [Chloroflexota bacterium]|nr:tRNA (N6-threonylcarbamoyladenosine(37)-N6)-methyltransferase TrmO [Chloroflexota bacterium]